MERDFMGLNSKEPMASVKREDADEGPEAHWPFMKNFSSHPNNVSLSAAMSRYHRMTKMYPPHPPINSNLKPNFSSFGQNVNGATTSQQFLGIPMTISSPAEPFVGFTDQWNSKKPSAAPAQMTIFYAGSVNVYEGITPEKAQAIMLLAGNGSSSSPNMNHGRPPMVSPFRVSTTVADSVVASHPITSHHLSLSSSPNTLSKPEPQRISMPVMRPSAVPQFRKASLARFLEKRKERVVSVAPYSCEKKPQEIPGNSNLGSASNSAANSMTSH